MCTFIRKHCHSPFVSTIKDQFSFPHRLSRFSYHTFKDITFDAIVYPTTGSSFGRISSEFENVDSPDLPLSMQQREEYIRQVICGMAELHSIGVVHGGKQTCLPKLQKAAEQDIRSPSWKCRPRTTYPRTY